MANEKEKKETKKSQAPEAAPLTPEQKAFKNQSEGNDVNKLKNPYSSAMTVSQAQEIIKKYGDFKGSEIPDDLQRARAILNK